MAASTPARPAAKIVTDESQTGEKEEDDLHVNTGIALDGDQIGDSDPGNDLDVPRPLSQKGRQYSFVSDTEEDDETSERPLRRELYIPGTEERYGYISIPEEQEAADRARRRPDSFYSNQGNPSTDSIPSLAHNTAYLESQHSLNPVREYLDPPQAQSPPKPSFWPYPEFKSLYTASPELRDVAEMHSRAATPAEVPFPPFSEQPTEDIVKVFVDARNELAARKNEIVITSPVDVARDPGHGDLKQSDVNMMPDGAEIGVPNEPAFREERGGDAVVGALPMPQKPPASGETVVKSPPIPTKRPTTIKSLQRNVEQQAGNPPQAGPLRHQRRTSLSPDRSSPLAKGQPIQAELELDSVELNTGGAVDPPVETKADLTEESTLAQRADMASQEAESTLKEAQSAEGEVKKKPAPPQRPNKFSSLRNQFAKTLDARLQKGPSVIKKAEPDPEPETDGLSDLRKSRARGPKRRPAGSVTKVKSWSASPVETWFEVPTDRPTAAEGEELDESGLVLGGTDDNQDTQLKRYITLEEVLKRKGGKVHTDDAGRIYIHDPMNEDATLWLDDSYNGEEIYIRSKIGIE